MKGYRLNGNQIKFPVYRLNVPVEELNLGARASNGLKRAGIFNAEELLDKDINKIRNLGAKSVREIKNALLNYSYDHMTAKEKAAFWKEIIA